MSSASKPPPIPGIEPNKKPPKWLKLLGYVLLAGLLVIISVFFYFSGMLKTPSLAIADQPTMTVVGLEVISLSPSTPTPFQPLPSDTPTPTPTFTPTPTATNTPVPTNTLVPSDTPYPTKTSLPPTTPAPSDGLPSSAFISGIYGQNQSHNLSCESRSAVDWAHYYGISIAEDTFLNSLPVSDDPDSGFVGSADGTDGQLPPKPYGVHADPVASLLRQYGLSATAVHGYSLQELRAQIAAGNPVIVWVYGDVWYGGSPVSYTASNGHTSTVVRYEHTVIVTGYDSTYIYILDGGTTYYRTYDHFKNSWATLGNMAVIAN